MQAPPVEVHPVETAIHYPQAYPGVIPVAPAPLPRAAVRVAPLVAAAVPMPLPMHAVPPVVHHSHAHPSVPMVQPEQKELLQQIKDLEADIHRLELTPEPRMEHRPIQPSPREVRESPREASPVVLPLAPPPQSLAVVSPRRPCAAGMFKLTRRVENGFPVWACGDKRLYSTKAGCWMIGGEAAMGSESGRMTSAEHHGHMPHALQLPWMVHIKGRGWVQDPESTIQDTPALPTTLRIHGADQADGVYRLIEGEVWRGHPVWADDERRIYTVEKGCWIVGPGTSMGMDAGWMMSALEHGGLAPNCITAWVVLDGKGGWGETDVRVEDISGEAILVRDEGSAAVLRHRGAVKRLFMEFADTQSGLLDVTNSMPAIFQQLHQLDASYAGLPTTEVEAVLSSLSSTTRPGHLDLPTFAKFLYLLSPTLSLGGQPSLDIPRNVVP